MTDNPFTKVPPHALEAERAVLGSMLMARDAIDVVAELLDDADFYNDANQRIYATMLRMHGEGVHGIDPVTVFAELGQKKALSDVGGAKYLAELLEAVAHPSHAKYYAEIVQDRSQRRQLIDTGSEMIREAFDEGKDYKDIVAEAESAIHRQIERDIGADAVDLTEVLFQVFDERSRERRDLVFTGYKALDDLTAGLEGGNVIVLAARVSVGKTALALSMAINCADNGTGVLFVSLEQSALEIAERMLSIKSKLPFRDIKTNNLREEDRTLLLEKSSELSDANIFVDDRVPRNMQQIAGYARLKVRRDGVKLIIIDYIQLIAPRTRRDPREVQVAEISQGIKHLARSLNVVIIVLAQLNREIEKRPNSEPRLSDLRESGAIEQDADLVWMIQRPAKWVGRDPAEPVEDDDKRAVLWVKKHRNGQTGPVNLEFSGSVMRFDDPHSDFSQQDLGF